MLAILISFVASIALYYAIGIIIETVYLFIFPDDYTDGDMMWWAHMWPMFVLSSVSIGACDFIDRVVEDYAQFVRSIAGGKDGGDE